MCLLCRDWEKGKLTQAEAMRNLDEMEFDFSDPEEWDHYIELLKKLAKESDS